MVYFNSLECVNLIVTTSNLKQTEKKAVLDNVLALNGTLLDTWKPECNTLVIKEILLTPKVLTCIIWGTPIVIPQYLIDFLKNVKEKRPPPDPKQYDPPCGEAVLPQNSVNLNYNPARKNLFANKIFVFTNKTIWNQMTDLIQAASGKTVLFDGDNITVNTIKSSTEEYLFLRDSESFSKSEQIKPILKYLKSKNQRVIPLQEIAISIINCSCSKDCNPNFNKAINLLAKAKTFSCGDALVLSTQTQLTEADIKMEEDTTVVPPSYENPISFDCGTDVEGSLKREGEELKRCNIEAKVSKINATDDVHQKSIKSKKVEASQTHSASKTLTTSNQSKVSPKKLTQSSITSFIETNKPEKGLSIFASAKQNTYNQINSNPFKRKLKTTETTAKSDRNDVLAEVSDDEEENIFKRPRIQKTGEEKSTNIDIGKESSNKNSGKVQNVLSSTVLTQNDTASSSFTLDMSTIKHEKVSDSGRPSITVGINKSNEMSSIKTEDVDPELEDFINSFKNTSIVKIKNCIARKVLKGEVNNSRSVFNSAGGVKNFKKFRKVCIVFLTFIIFSLKIIFLESHCKSAIYYYPKK